MARHKLAKPSKNTPLASILTNRERMLCWAATFDFLRRNNISKKIYIGIYSKASS